jgi:hypothetical protein
MAHCHWEIHPVCPSCSQDSDNMVSASEAASRFWSKYPSRRTPSEPEKVDSSRKPNSSDLGSKRRPSQKLTTEKITNIPSLLGQSSIGLSRAKAAAKCIVQEHRDAQYNANTIKWCRIICQETRKFSFGLLLNGQKRTTEVRQAQIRAQAEIDDRHHEFVRLFLSLFSRLASTAQKPTPPILGNTLIDLVQSFMTTSGQHGGRQEQIWLDGLRELKKFLANLDPNEGMECLREALIDCEAEKLARFHIYSALFQMVWERYETEWKHGGGVHEWELAASRLRRYASMTADFLTIVKSLPSDVRFDQQANVIRPAELAIRLSDATRFAEGHSILVQAHEAAADMSDPAVNTNSTETKASKQKFNEVVELYFSAYYALIDIDKANAGFAMAKIGFMHWNSLLQNDRSKAIPFLNRALRLEKDVEPDSWWLEKAKIYITVYEEELRTREQERLRKEEEKLKRREERAREARELAERVRCQVMSDKLEILKIKGEGVRSVEALLAFLEWVQAHYSPPELRAQNQLQQHIEELGKRLRPRRIGLKKIIMLYHPDKNGKQGDMWKDICAEVTKVYVPR